MCHVAATGTSLRTALLAGVLVLTAPVFSLAGAVDETRAAAVMAAYLRHIAALTTWPREGRGPIVIGVLGTDPNGVMGPIRSRIAGSERLIAQGRPVHVLDLKVAADSDDMPVGLDACDLLFLSEDAADHWAHIEATVRSRPIVTVSEMSGFAERGGMVEYFIDLGTGKVRLIVNLESMKRAGVTLSARLLALESVIVLREGEGA